MQMVSKIFIKKCLDAGVDSILIADVPVHESKELHGIAKKVGITQIFIAPPDASEETLKQISELGSGLYLFTFKSRNNSCANRANMLVEEVLAKLKEYDAPKPILGFGISIAKISTTGNKS